MNTVNDLLKKPLYSGYSTGFTLQTILPAYKVCLKKKKKAFLKGETVDISLINLRLKMVDMETAN